MRFAPHPTITYAKQTAQTDHQTEPKQQRTGAPRATHAHTHTGTNREFIKIIYAIIVFAFGDARVCVCVFLEPTRKRHRFRGCHCQITYDVVMALSSVYEAINIYKIHINVSTAEHYPSAHKTHAQHGIIFAVVHKNHLVISRFARTHSHDRATHRPHMTPCVFYTKPTASCAGIIKILLKY